MSGKNKDASSKLHEKHQLILADLLRDEDNKYCADCLAKGPRWASWNLGVFMCIRCAGIHRNLGVHVSRVKSVNLDSWTPEQIESIQKGGNRHAKNLYEANLPANFRRPQDDYAVEQFIRAKYERKMYMAKGVVPKEQPPAQEQKAKVKSKKTLSSSSTSIKSTGQIDQTLAVPRPSGRRSPSPLSSSKSAPSSTRNSASNLLTLDSSTPSSQQATSTKIKTGSPPPLLDLLTGSSPSLSTPPTNNASSNSSSFSQSSDPFGSTSTSSSTAAGSTDLMFGSAASGGPGSRQQPSVPASSKESIMSLYTQHQPQYASYTAQGYPVNAYYYQQQQAAAIHMAQVTSLQQQQVNQVTAQMQQIKMNQGGSAGAQPFSGGMSNGSISAPAGAGGMGMGVVGGTGGQTLNPTLW